MAEDNREGHNPGAAIGDMDIAAAHAADDNPHQRAAGLGIDDRHVPGLDAVGLDEYACLPSCHMFFPSRGSDLAPDAASSLAARQIGRASCRERVCQYV